MQQKLLSSFCGTMCLQAASKLLAYRTRLSWRRSAIYSNLTNTAFDLLGVGSTGTASLWTKNSESDSRSLKVIRNYTEEWAVYVSATYPLYA